MRLLCPCLTAEGWAHDMQHDTLKARVAYSQALPIYDSIIKKDPNMFNLVNRAFIIQALPGKNASNKALDEIFKDPLFDDV